MKKIVFIAFLAAFTSARHSEAQSLTNLAVYNLSGLNGTNLSVAVSNTAQNVSATSLIRSSGLVNNTTGTNAFAASGWTTNTSVDLDDWFGLTISPTEGFMLSLSNFYFAERRSGTGIRNWELRLSLDGFSTFSTITNVTVPDDTSTRQQNVSFGGSFTNITNTIGLRLYGFANEAGTGTWRVENNSSVSSFRIDGSVVVVPEPSTYAMLTLAAVGLGGYVMRRRRR